MRISIETWLADSLYRLLYLKLRFRYVSTKPLASKTVYRVVRDNFMNLNEHERYYLRLYIIHGCNVKHVAKDAESTYKKARRTIDIAIRKMMSPECLIHAKAIRNFKHSGPMLSESLILSKQTVNRLAQSGIETTGDLGYWYKLGPEYLFRIPEIGQGRIIEILMHLQDKGYM